MHKHIHKRVCRNPQLLTTLLIILKIPPPKKKQTTVFFYKYQNFIISSRTIRMILFKTNTYSSCLGKKKKFDFCDLE